MFEENMGMWIGEELAKSISSLLRHAIKLLHLYQLLCFI